MTRGIGRQNLRRYPCSGQRGGGSLENALPVPANLACVRIVDEDRLTIPFDSLIIA